MSLMLRVIPFNMKKSYFNKAMHDDADVGTTDVRDSENCFSLKIDNKCLFTSFSRSYFFFSQNRKNTFYA